MTHFVPWRRDRVPLSSSSICLLLELDAPRQGKKNTDGRMDALPYRTYGRKTSSSSRNGRLSWISERRHQTWVSAYNYGKLSYQVLDIIFLHVSQMILSKVYMTMPTRIKTTTSTMILDCHAGSMHQRCLSFFFAMALLCSFRVPSAFGSLAPPPRTITITTITTTTIRSALSLRGGKSSNDNNPIELNPHWVPPGRGGSNPHQVWLETQQTYNDQSFVTYENVGLEPPSQSSPASSARDRFVNHVTQFHQTSPSLSVCAWSCLAISILWQIPACEPFLRNWFICSRQNVGTFHRFPSVLLSTISHASLKHLAVNIFALVTAGPVVQRSLSTTRWPLWPMLVGAGMAGSTMFLTFGGRHGSCLGLSGVTLALVAMQARIFPTRQLGLVIGVIPVKLPAEYLLWGLLTWSLLGSFVSRPDDGIAHLTHLGGLLFGMAYYELWRNRRQWQPQVRKYRKLLPRGFHY
jgi:membrane associated rhomboid family serine protease